MTTQQRYNILLARANARYAQAKLKAAGYSTKDISYMAPETMPQIASEQVKACLWIMAEGLVVDAAG